MSPRLEFFFDYGSPYSYLADTRLPELRKRTGCELVYRPMLLGGVYQATGNRSPAEEPVEAKRRYGALDLQRWVRHYGVPFQLNPHFPINTLRIMRAAQAAERAGVFETFHAAMFPAFWAEAKNLGDAQVLAAVLRDAGLDADALLAAASDPAIKDSLRATTEDAVQRGVFGAPSFFVEGELFFGNDRLAFVEEALRATGG